MAGTITHAYFSLDLYDKLSIRSKELLVDYKEDLKFFAQNTDVLFFYNIIEQKFRVLIEVCRQKYHFEN